MLLNQMKNLVTIGVMTRNGNISVCVFCCTGKKTFRVDHKLWNYVICYQLKTSLLPVRDPIFGPFVLGQFSSDRGEIDGYRMRSGSTVPGYHPIDGAPTVDSMRDR